MDNSNEIDFNHLEFSNIIVILHLLYKLINSDFNGKLDSDIPIDYPNIYNTIKVLISTFSPKFFLENSLIDIIKTLYTEDCVVPNSILMLKNMYTSSEFIDELKYIQDKGDLFYGFDDISFTYITEIENVLTDKYPKFNCLFKPKQKLENVRCTINVPRMFIISNYRINIKSITLILLEEELARHFV